MTESIFPLSEADMVALVEELAAKKDAAAKSQVKRAFEGSQFADFRAEINRLVALRRDEIQEEEEKIKESAKRAKKKIERAKKREEQAIRAIKQTAWERAQVTATVLKDSQKAKRRQEKLIKKSKKKVTKAEKGLAKAEAAQDVTIERAELKADEYEGEANDILPELQEKIDKKKEKLKEQIAKWESQAKEKMSELLQAAEMIRQVELPATEKAEELRVQRAEAELADEQDALLKLTQVIDHLESEIIRLDKELDTWESQATTGVVGIGFT